jgi:hypothetical protein
MRPVKSAQTNMGHPPEPKMLKRVAQTSPSHRVSQDSECPDGLRGQCLRIVGQHNHQRGSGLLNSAQEMT